MTLVKFIKITLPFLIATGILGTLFYQQKRSTEPSTSPSSPASQSESQPLLTSTLAPEESVDVSQILPDKIREQEEKKKKEEELFAKTLPGLKIKAEKLSNTQAWHQMMNGDFLAFFIKSIDEIANGYIPAQTFQPFRSERPFTAINHQGQWILSQNTMQRYSPLVEIFLRIKPQEAVAILKALHPFLQEKMKELGYPDTDIILLLKKACRVVLDTPLYNKPQPLEKVTSTLYRWQNPEIEALLPVQKFLLRLSSEDLNALQIHIHKFLELLP